MTKMSTTFWGKCTLWKFLEKKGLACRSYEKSSRFVDDDGLFPASFLAIELQCVDIR